jgi:RNA polymerase sigma-70 factor (ECF subfamily)
MSDRIERLCGQAKAGDVAAASELVSLFYERVFAYLRRLCGSDEEAADLTQKVFFKAWVSLSSFEGRSSFSTWIHGIAHHVYVDWRRRQNRLDPKTDEWWETCAANEPSPFENTSEKDLAHRLFKTVEQLEDDAREVVHLHYYQGLSLRETAEALGIATSTVKYRLREALDCLRARAAEPKFRTT